jgi:molybdate transport system substrate-binding protein
MNLRTPARRTRSTIAVAAGLMTAVALAGCGSGGQGGGSGSSGTTGTLDVLAASSLTEAFGTLADDFEKSHPGVKVKLSFDSSTTLAEQVDQGAPADVLATADEDSMQTVVDHDGTDGKPQVFATNHLVLAVPEDNPQGIRSISDLDRPGVKYVVCVDTAPCGKLAVKVLAATGVNAHPASEEVDAKATLAKLALDEADAGLVYASDVATAGGKVDDVDLPTTDENLNTYPIAALSGARKPTLAHQWVRLVLSDKGQQTLADAGFGKP